MTSTPSFGDSAPTAANVGGFGALIMVSSGRGSATYEWLWSLWGLVYVPLSRICVTPARAVDVDRIVSEAPAYGWRLVFADRHPHAGGPHYYATCMENDEGFEVEVVGPVTGTPVPAGEEPAAGVLA